MGKSIGILSLKGGVGKTTSVVSLGNSLADEGKKVLLVDGNFSSPNLGMHLKIVDPEKTIHHVLKRKANPKDSVYKLGKFDVMPASVFYNSKINVFELKNKLRHLKRKYDFILIDSSPALNDETLAVMMASDEIFIVTTPDYPTLSSTLKAVKLAKQRGTPINGLILNKVHNRKFEIPSDYVEDTLDTPVLASIPHDLNFLKAVSEFTPYTNYKPKSKASKEFRKLAEVLSGNKIKQKSLRDFFRLPPKKQDINREVFYENYFK